MIRQQKTGFFSSHRKTLEDGAKFPVKKSEMIGNIDGQMFFLYAQKYNLTKGFFCFSRKERGYEGALFVI